MSTSACDNVNEYTYTIYYNVYTIYIHNSKVRVAMCRYACVRVWRTCLLPYAIYLRRVRGLTQFQVRDTCLHLYICICVELGTAFVTHACTYIYIYILELQVRGNCNLELQVRDTCLHLYIYIHSTQHILYIHTYIAHSIIHTYIHTYIHTIYIYTYKQYVYIYIHINNMYI